MSQIQAVIMAGGEGSRLRPLTSNMPKPMLPVGNRPLMEHIIRLLRKHGFTEVTATVQFLSSVIRNYFADGSDLGVSLSYSLEDLPLGTAGSVLNARSLLSGSFLVVSGDSLTDLDLDEVVRFHRERAASATLVLRRMADPLEFGIVMTAEDGRIERFLEKPTWGQVFTDTINTGIYVLEPEVLDLIPPDGPFDFSAELFPLMLDKGLPLYGYVTDEYWTDVGTTDAFLEAQYDVLSGAVVVDVPGFELRESVWVGEGVEIDPSARVEGPAIIGVNSRIGAGAIVGPRAVVGGNARIDDQARVEGGVVMDGAHVGPMASLRAGILGRGASLQQGATVEERAIVGDDAVVGAGALIKTRLKVYPSRTVEAGAIVTESVVQERRATRSLFGSRGVSGIVNAGMTPMVAVRLGMAYGSTLPRGSVVYAARDASRAARTMKRALIAGLNSTGVNCHDLELMPVPLTRFTVRSRQAAGGVGVGVSPRNSEVVEIRLFDAEGADLSESAQRKIERVFFREDYRWAGAARLGELEFSPHAPEQYVAGLVRALDLESIRAAELKVVVDYAFGPACRVGPSLMGRLGCDVLALHAHTNESRPVLSGADLRAMAEHLSEQVVNSGSDLGVLLEPGGEIAHLIDDRGRRVGDERALLAFLGHEVERGAGTVAVPVSCSSVCEAVADEGDAMVRRTPTSLTALMAAAGDDVVGFAGDAEGTLIFPAFMPAPDGLMTFCKALEVVAASGRSLARLVDELPAVHLVRRDVPTPWQHKGAVMRRLAERPGPGRLVLLDGVKIVEDDRWVLVIPYPDEPLCAVWSEAPTGPEAEALAERYAGIVEAIVAEDAAGKQMDLSTS
jgi:mannose-1-phosphate guanylyltransferase/phosphomannomutase